MGSDALPPRDPSKIVFEPSQQRRSFFIDPVASNPAGSSGDPKIIESTRSSSDGATATQPSGTDLRSPSPRSRAPRPSHRPTTRMESSSEARYRVSGDDRVLMTPRGSPSRAPDAALSDAFSPSDLVVYPGLCPIERDRHAHLRAAPDGNPPPGCAGQRHRRERSNVGEHSPLPQDLTNLKNGDHDRDALHRAARCCCGLHAAAPVAAVAGRPKGAGGGAQAQAHARRRTARAVGQL